MTFVSLFGQSGVAAGIGAVKQSGALTVPHQMTAYVSDVVVRPEGLYGSLRMQVSKADSAVGLLQKFRREDRCRAPSANWPFFGYGTRREIRKPEMHGAPRKC